MSEDSVEKIVFAISDYANALEAATVSLRKNLQGLAKFKEYDMSKINWTQAEGSKGPYEKTEDTNNEHYRALREDLKEHQGKMTKDGFFLWVFQNGVTIGRKKKA